MNIESYYKSYMLTSRLDESARSVWVVILSTVASSVSSPLISICLLLDHIISHPLHLLSFTYISPLICLTTHIAFTLRISLLPNWLKSWIEPFWKFDELWLKLRFLRSRSILENQTLTSLSLLTLHTLFKIPPTNFSSSAQIFRNSLSPNSRFFVCGFIVFLRDWLRTNNDLDTLELIH